MQAKVQKKIKRKLTQKELDKPRNRGKQLRTIKQNKTIDEAVILVCGNGRLVKKYNKMLCKGQRKKQSKLRLNYLIKITILNFISNFIKFKFK